MNVVSNWINFYPGDGVKIWLGEDPILGLEDQFKLTDGLLNALHDKYIYFISQAKENSWD